MNSRKGGHFSLLLNIDDAYITLPNFLLFRQDRQIKKNVDLVQGV